MPKEKRVTNHPCHLLSLPSARRFWCRHCMTVFEDAITRWRHSRSCRYGSSNNFMKRRELEAKALQNTAVLNPTEAKLEQSIQLSDLASTSGATSVRVTDENGVEILTTPEDFTCFICHKKFNSMEEMRHHVRYPCNASEIHTSSVPHPRNSVPVFIERLSPGQPWQPGRHPIEIQPQQAASSYIQANPQSRPGQNLLEQHLQAGGSMDIHIDQGSYNQNLVHYDSRGFPNAAETSGESVVKCEEKELKPTTIYVNEKGETVIEVENLDLSADGGELSLAHLLTQLSQQGVVFDKKCEDLQASDFVVMDSDEGVEQAQNVYQVEEGHHSQQFGSEDQHTINIGTEALTAGECQGDLKMNIEDDGQPTAEDAANTLAQLAGFRGFMQPPQQQQTVAIKEDHVLEENDTVTVHYATGTEGEFTTVQQIQLHHPEGIIPQQQQQQKRILAPQHMSLQEVLTSSSLTSTSGQHLRTPDDTVKGDGLEPVAYTRLESAHYMLDPQTGEQILQQDVDIEADEAVVIHQNHNQIPSSTSADLSANLTQAHNPQQPLVICQHSTLAVPQTEIKFDLEEDIPPQPIRAANQSVPQHALNVQLGPSSHEDEAEDEDLVNASSSTDTALSEEVLVSISEEVRSPIEGGVTISQAHIVSRDVAVIGEAQAGVNLRHENALHIQTEAQESEVSIPADSQMPEDDHSILTENMQTVLSHSPDDHTAGHQISSQPFTIVDSDGLQYSEGGICTQEPVSEPQNSTLETHVTKPIVEGNSQPDLGMLGQTVDGYQVLEIDESNQVVSEDEGTLYMVTSAGVVPISQASSQ